VSNFYEENRDRLSAYREIATALAYGYMNHKHRKEQILVLWMIISHDRVRWQECDYRNTLDALLVILKFTYMSGVHNTHSEVKAILWTFVTTCQNAINKPESILSHQSLSMPSPAGVDDAIPF